MIVAQLGGGFDLMSLLNPAGEAVKSFQEGEVQKAKIQADAAAAAAAAMPTACPTGMQPNPQWAAIPPQARAQAAAQGIQACIPGGPATGIKLRIRFVGAGRTYSGTSDGFANALQAARAQPGGGVVIRITVLQDGKSILRRSVSLAAAVQPSGAVAYGPGAPGAAPAAAVVAATPGPGGVFSCPPGYVIARDQAGNVVCAPPSVAAAAGGLPGGPGVAAEGATTRRAGRGGRGGGRVARGRGRGGRLRGWGLGDPAPADRRAQIATLQQVLTTAGFPTPVTGTLDNHLLEALNNWLATVGRPMITMSELAVAPNLGPIISQIAATLRGGLGGLETHRDIEYLENRWTRYMDAIKRYPHAPTMPALGIRSYAAPKPPGWMQQSLPPPAMTFAGAFGTGR
jgi:hypothetical protein